MLGKRRHHHAPKRERVHQLRRQARTVGVHPCHRREAHSRTTYHPIASRQSKRRTNAHRRKAPPPFFLLPSPLFPTPELKCRTPQSNGNEGRYFVPNNITTASRFLSFISLNWPLASSTALATIASVYDIDPLITASHPKYDTDGLHPPYATSVSGAAVSWQQAAYNLYGETTFVCPAYWLADAYTAKNKKAWRYQVSTPNAFHGVDIGFLTGDPVTATSTSGPVGEEFRRGFQEVWGRFIVNGDPTLSVVGAGAGSGVAAAAEGRWRAWGEGPGGGRDMLNLNVTQGTAGRADWSVVDALAWEGGRGKRCAFWAGLGVN